MKTFKIPNYPNLEFMFNTNTYANNKNTYVGITCIRNTRTIQRFNSKPLH